MALDDGESDENLMRRLHNGDRQAFALLVRRHTDRFFRLAWRTVQNDQEAEDIVQEAFLKLWQKPRQYNPGKGTKFTTWFYRVVSNLSIDHVRRRRNIGSMDQAGELPAAEELVDSRMAMDEQQVAIEKAIESLPERQKTALNLCFYEDVSNNEAAEIMGVGIKALESLLMRAKAGIRDVLSRDGFLEEEAENGRRKTG